MAFRKKPVPSAPVGRQRQSRLRDGKKPSAFSYYSRRSDELLTTGRKMARTETAARTLEISRYWRQRFGLGILLIAAFICLMYVTTLTAEPRVAVVSSAPPAGLQPVTVYQSAAQQYLEQSIVNRNKITINTTQLSDYLSDTFPELAAAQVSLPLLSHRVQIQLTPAQPIMILATGNGSFALDSRGVALASGSRLADLSELNLPLVTDDSDLAVSLRKQALPGNNAQFIAAVSAYLRAKDIPIAAMSLPASTNELHVRVANQPYYIKFNLTDNRSREQAGTYIAVTERLQEQGIVPKEYVDVRVRDRAYYR